MILFHLNHTPKTFEGKKRPLDPEPRSIAMQNPRESKVEISGIPAVKPLGTTSKMATRLQTRQMNTMVRANQLTRLNQSNLSYLKREKCVRSPDHENASQSAPSQ
jgi:hypothetical protein